MTNRKNILRVVQCNTDRLYGPLDEAISYLKEIKSKYPDAQLEENWYGYEDMEMCFYYFSEETDEEYQDRIELEERKKQREDAERVRQKEIAKLKKQKEEIERKLGGL